MPSEYLSQNEIDAASLVRIGRVQRAGAAEDRPGRRRRSVARAYLDQLNRSKGISAARARGGEVGAGQGREGQGRPRRRIDQLDVVAKQVEQDASSASGPDAERLKSLAAAMKARATRLRG